MTIFQGAVTGISIFTLLGVCTLWHHRCFFSVKVWAQG